MTKTNERTYVPEEVKKIEKPCTTTPIDVPDFTSRSYLLLLKLIDILISSIIIAPCVIAYWRGTWELIEQLLLPDDRTISSSISFGLGCLGHMFFTICQDCFKKRFDPDRKRLTYYIASRSYTAIFGFICVNMWRGVWNLCDSFTSKSSLPIILVTTILSLVALVVIRTARNLAAAPFVVSIDARSMYFEITTIFNTQRFRRPGLYFLDTFFSAIVVGTLVVVAWRGVWVTLDLTFYQNNKLLSALGSLIIGYGIVGITFAVQPILRVICRRTSGTTKLVLADSYYLISFIGAVNVWRGIWVLLDVYLYPENHLKSCYVSHTISFLILTVLNCANSILVRGIAIDGEDVDNSCVEFPIAYVKLHLYNKRVRKYQEKSRMEGQDKLAEHESLIHT